MKISPALVASALVALPLFSAAQMAQKKHDPLAVKSAMLSADQKSVFLEISDIKPVLQMQFEFDLKAADGAALKTEVINTIHALGKD